MHPTTLTVAREQVERFRWLALAATQETDRARYITTADAIIIDLLACGLISSEEADTMAKQWVEQFAVASVKALPATDERLLTFIACAGRA